MPGAAGGKTQNDQAGEQALTSDRATTTASSSTRRFTSKATRVRPRKSESYQELLYTVGRVIAGVFRMVG